MNRILIIDTTWPINSRTQKFLNTLSREYFVSVAAWNRGPALDKNNTQSKHYILETNINYGNKLKKLACLPIFFAHTAKAFKINRASVIFASHWDSLICAVLIKMFFDKHITILYDCLDLPTSRNKLLRSMLRFLEAILIKKVDLTIFASRYFPALYRKELKHIVFENYPSKSLLLKKTSPPEWYTNQSNIFSESNNSISWIGVVRYLEILENILLAIKGTSISFLVFGDGPDFKKFVNLVHKYNLERQVITFGRYSHKDLPFIYEISRLVWAAYPTKDYNAIYAVSNKYFECSLFQKVPIFSRKTKMGKSLCKHYNNIVLVDEYDVIDIQRKIMKALRCPRVRPYKYEADTLWEDKEAELLKEIRHSLC